MTTQGSPIPKTPKAGGTNVTTEKKQGKISDFLSARKNLRTTPKRLISESNTPIKQQAALDLEKDDVVAKVDDVIPESSQNSKGHFNDSVKVIPEKREQTKLAQSPVTIQEEIKFGQKPFHKIHDEVNAEPILQPAFDRFSQLLTPTPTRLQLPQSHALLLRVHHALDSVCQIMGSRDQPAIFHRIQQVVQNIIGRDVTVEHLKQINHLVGGYEFRQTTIVHNGRKTKSFAIALLPKTSLSNAELIARRQSMHDALVAHVHAHHKVFLGELGIKIPEDAKFKAWHPKFQLSSVPEIPQQELWEDDKKSPEDLHNVPLQIREVLEDPKQASLASHSKEDQKFNEKPQTLDLQTESRPTKKPSVMERIALKEKKKVLENMIQDKNNDQTLKERELQSTYELCDSVAFLFASSGKGSLLVGDIVGKIASGSKNVTSPSIVLDGIKDLARIVPDWIQLLPAANGSTHVVRLNKTIPIKEVKVQIATKKATVK